MTADFTGSAESFAATPVVRELFTDLYELTMLQAYFNEGMDGEAVFDLYSRSLPPERNFLVACGLDDVLAYLEGLSFSAASLAYLASLGLFTRPFLDYLSGLRFTGDVRAVPEGTVVFAQEPLIEVSAPIAQAQLIETYLLNQVTFQTLIASKGARLVLAAKGRALVDFGSRRAHAADAALKAARALYIAGFDSTSNLLAGSLYGIPVAGTMAHSYIQAHETEAEAFRDFLRSYPETILLLDTYDTEAAAQIVAGLASEQGGLRIRGVRLDSGDLGALARKVRAIFDAAGLADVGIYASGGLDEKEIEALVGSEAPISGFGVGTAAVVSSDAPVLDTAYKLVSYDGEARMKLSEAKATLPGRKQVYRRFKGGEMTSDTIALEGEATAGEPLLQAVMRRGERSHDGFSDLSVSRARLRRQLGQLPPVFQRLGKPPKGYRARLSPGLEALRRRLTQRLTHEG